MKQLITLMLFALCLSASAAKKSPAQSLLLRLQKLQKMGYMYGHQDDPFYGTTWEWDFNRSDTKELTGDYPAVMGFDLGGIEMDDAKNLDSVPFNRMRDEIIAHHQRGGIITISWHPRNPMLGTTAWIESDMTGYNASVEYLNKVNRQDIARLIPHPRNTVASIIPGGSLNDKYMIWLKRVATFLGSLRTEKGEAIPFIFRPYHENNGSWFWWGQNNCTDAQYHALWNMTQDYLNECMPGVILWSYSPNLQGYWTEEQWMARYPGDDRVDLIGEDAYQWGTEEDFKRGLDADLTLITEIAKKHGKLIAMTECGYQNSPDATWWTRVFKPIVDKYPICYFLPWRNYKKEHFGAAKDLKVADDFLKLYQAKNTLFLQEIKKVK